MKFEKFSIANEIKDNLANMGFVRTTDIQFKTIPAIMNGEDVLAIAQTGTGKTAAFAIPIINRIHTDKSSSRSHGIQCLVLVPTRELAKQIGQICAKLSKKTRTKTYAIYGGVEQDPQKDQLEGGIDVLIATPGRMFDLIAQGSVDVRFVKTLVLDEADHMLDLGFIDDIKSIKRKLNHTHQTLFFSATINPTIKKLAYSQIKSQALRIQVSPEKMVSKNITHYITKVEMDDKRHVLLNFMRSNPKAKIIVFVRTQVRAERVLAHLKKNEVPVVAIHGGMVQEEREENLEWFRNQPAGALIATDVTARGIDLSSISHVINYDIPDEPENYVHRVGRTGRGFAKGEAVSFCSSEEIEKLEAIESFLETEIPVLDLDPEMLEVEAPPDVDNLKISDILAMEEARYSKPKKSDKHKAEKSKSGSPKKKKR